MNLLNPALDIREAHLWLPRTVKGRDPIGEEDMVFALDGRKISSNASKQWSGTIGDLFSIEGKNKLSEVAFPTVSREISKSPESVAAINFIPLHQEVGSEEAVKGANFRLPLTRLMPAHLFRRKEQSSKLFCHGFCQAGGIRKRQP
jgi:hypothetical protein